MRKKRHKDFSYLWDQDSFNPITHEAMFYIHFKRKREKNVRDALPTIGDFGSFQSFEISLRKWVFKRRPSIGKELPKRVMEMEFLNLPKREKSANPGLPTFQPKYKRLKFS
jgi:hypothetical protein